MPPEQNNNDKSNIIKHILFVIVAIIIVSIVVWYFRLQIPLPTNQPSRIDSPKKLSVEDKYKILEKLAKENTSVTTREEKLKILSDLEKQSPPNPMSESDKLKLLESLSR